MSPRQPRYNMEEHARMAKEIYEGSILPRVEKEHHGRYLALDVDTGEYEIDDTALPAVHRLYDRFPNAQIFVFRIGYAVSRWFTPPVEGSRL